MGVGKLFRQSDNQFVAKVDYQVFTNPAAANWWGELTLIDNVRLSEGDRFIIELKNKRKIKCRLKKRVNRAVSGIPTRYIYRVKGISAIE